MSNVRIQCPICSENGRFVISEEAIKNVERGILAVNIAEGFICSHNFIAYVDKNFAVRDYFTTDFKIELPQISIEKIKNQTFPSETIDMDLIKLNMHALSLIHI